MMTIPIDISMSCWHQKTLAGGITIRDIERVNSTICIQVSIRYWLEKLLLFVNCCQQFSSKSQTKNKLIEQGKWDHREKNESY